MLNRKMFFWLERLKISRSERRAIITLIVLLLILVFVNILLKPVPPFKRSSYAKIEAAFKHRTALLHRKNKRLMAPFKGIPASAVISDTLPAVATFKQQETININKAGIKGLSKLPGIGPAYAQNIIDYRNNNGSFTSKKELLEVKGIGDARFAKIKPLIILGKVDKQAEIADTTQSKPIQRIENHYDETKQITASKQINVNKATVEMLITLPGIGPAYAQNIVDYRGEHGPFSTFEELLKVKGIGKKRLENLKPFIKLTGNFEKG